MAGRESDRELWGLWGPGGLWGPRVWGGWGLLEPPQVEPEPRLGPHMGRKSHRCRRILGGASPCHGASETSSRALKLQLITEPICINYKARGKCLQSLPSAQAAGAAPAARRGPRGGRGVLSPTGSQDGGRRGWCSPKLHPGPQCLGGHEAAASPQPPPPALAPPLSPELGTAWPCQGGDTRPSLHPNG